jgi:cell fate regulator YaaT (PSP1 superfamily)
MPEIVGVRFQPVTKIYFFDPNEQAELDIDTRVIVETSRGREMGTVVQPLQQVPNSKIKGQLKKVLRRATPVDLIQAEEYKAKEPEAIEKCNELIKELNVPIKVLEANYSFDGSRLVVSFAAEQRVDFRDLSKQLARSLRTKIEMKQLGARDETKIIDGYGRCGRRLCCSSWLTEFHPVSIKMAKEQRLPLAPAEISGLCGRLLCCLAYENDQYREMKKDMPKIKSQVMTKDGVVGIVRGLNVIKETVLLETETEDSYVEVLVQDVDVVPQTSSGQNKSNKSSKKNQKDNA